MGVDLVDRTAWACSGPTRRGQPISGRTVLQTTSALSTTSGVARRARSSSAPTPTPTATGRRRSTRSSSTEGWTQLDSVGAVVPARPARRPATFARGVEGASPPASSRWSTCSTRAASATPQPFGERVRLPRLLAQAALRRGRGRAAGARSATSRAGRRPAGDRHDTRRTSTCTWSATSAPSASPPASSRVGSLARLLRALLPAAHPRPACDRQPCGARRCRRTTAPTVERAGAGDMMGQYLPIVVPAGARRRVRRAQLRRLAPAGAAPPVVGQGGAVRVRHRAQPRAARALPGPLLPRRDDLHHVRHRDHLPLPVRGRSCRSSARYGFVGDARLRRRRSSSRSSTSSPTARSTGVRCSGCAAARPAPCRPSARSASTIRRVGTRGPRRRADEPRSGSLMGRQTSATTGSAGSSTTSSPASSRTSSSGRAAAAVVAGHRSAWPAAPSR